MKMGRGVTIGPSCLCWVINVGRYLVLVLDTGTRLNFYRQKGCLRNFYAPVPIFAHRIYARLNTIMSVRG